MLLDIVCTYARFHPEGDCLYSWQAKKSPFGIAVDENYLYISDHCTNRIEIYEKQRGRLVREWGEKGEGPSQFKKPSSIAVDDMWVYVCDRDNNRIQMFDKKNGNFHFMWGNTGFDVGQFRCPHGITVDEQVVYVADAWNHRIQTFTKTGKIIDQWRIDGSGLPISIAVDKLYAFITITHTDRILCLNKHNGHLLYVLSLPQNSLPSSSPSSSLTTLPQPWGLTVSGPFVFVTDRINHTILIFDKRTRKVVKKWGKRGRRRGQLECPCGVAVDADYVYVIDLTSRIQAFV